ncbi:hypothetical protein H671_8g19729 [Cricetulus griseus]|nr:hypothetical protein H671_8g19729 [Cricetulus griseus]
MDARSPQEDSDTQRVERQDKSRTHVYDWAFGLHGHTAINCHTSKDDTYLGKRIGAKMQMDIGKETCVANLFPVQVRNEQRIQKRDMEETC